ncbi:protein cortex-like [Diabrotica virgifera virgifera]|uniref:Protein cortex-like n=2 Tax=Diabrotica virgifera virgifera TaxID=50390 RepID=A0ABM5JVF8_DIAVI|nr:protein cortex-like [Diabrotica virgifera virgifera]
MKKRQTGRPIALDRFIRKRSISDFETHESTIDDDPFDNAESHDESFHYVNIARERFFHNNYRSMLKNIMLSNKSIIGDNFGNNNVQLKLHEIIEHWPVEARKKPLLLNSPEVFLDLPDLNAHYLNNIVDWGNTGYIATIFDSKVHLWHPNKKDSLEVTTELTVARCIRWNRDGSLFAVAVNNNQVEVFDILGNKFTSNIGSCVCSVQHKDRCRSQCNIISAEWTKSNILLTGCSYGTLTMFSANLKWLNFRFIPNSAAIVKLALSCHENYLASVGIDHTVFIMNYHNFDGIQTFPLPTPKAIAWHPWKDSLLVLGQMDYLFLWNVQSQNISCSMPFPNTYIDSLIFNPMSAELLVSQHCYDEDGNEGVSYLRVMKNLNCIVDEVRCNKCKIPYLMWDPTGTKLGAATTEENFCIWDFFGRGTKQEKKYKGIMQNVDAKDIFKTTNFRGVIR